ncbi:MAG: hypothetical protein HN348_22105, partial [Proteobacteria bacterium]|nr:hypothetical protein [Pseudomonadota bacterium]
ATDVVTPAVRATTNRFGGMAQLSYFFPLWEGGIEPAVRIATFDDAAHMKDNGDVSIIHMGVNWRDITPGVDLGAGFVHRMEREGNKAPNDTMRLWAQFNYPVKR